MVYYQTTFLCKKFIILRDKNEIALIQKIQNIYINKKFFI